MRTPGGLMLPDADPETRALLRAPTDPRPLAAAVAGERFTVNAASDFFISDPSARVADLYDAAVLVTDVALTTIEPLIALLENVARRGVPILVVAPMIADDALLLLIVNQLRGVLYVAACDADPATRERIAFATGAVVVEDPAHLATAQLGRAKRAILAHAELAIA